MVAQADEVPVYDSLEGHVAVVTGSSRGLGAEIAHQLAERGATVYASARDPKQVEAREGVVPIMMDVTDADAIAAAVQEIASAHDKLDILVNNAGVADGWDVELHNLEPDRLDLVLNTNIRGPMLVTKAFLPMLLGADAGRVVNMSSGMGAMGEGMSGRAPAYRASKAALNAFTVYLDAVYNEEGLLANCVCPGWVRTDMGGSNADLPVEKGADTPVWLARFKQGAPSGLWWRNKRVIDW